MGGYIIPALGMTGEILIFCYPVVALVFMAVLIFLLFPPGDASAFNKKLRKDGCMVVLAILGSFLGACLWRIGIPVVLIAYHCSGGNGRTCCGISCAKTTRNLEAGDHQSRASSVTRGAADRPPS